MYVFLAHFSLSIYVLMIIMAIKNEFIAIIILQYIGIMNPLSPGQDRTIKGDKLYANKISSIRALCLRSTLKFSII